LGTVHRNAVGRGGSASGVGHGSDGAKRFRRLGIRDDATIGGVYAGEILAVTVADLGCAMGYWQDGRLFTSAVSSPLSTSNIELRLTYLLSGFNFLSIYHNHATDATSSGISSE
jgi:hypothetical protein